MTGRQVHAMLDAPAAEALPLVGLFGVAFSIVPASLSVGGN
jgi:hypothetical protein